MFYYWHLVTLKTNKIKYKEVFMWLMQVGMQAKLRQIGKD